VRAIVAVGAVEAKVSEAPELSGISHSTLFAAIVAEILMGWIESTEYAFVRLTQPSMLVLAS
jgi:hypothetical protein